MQDWLFDLSVDTGIAALLRLLRERIPNDPKQKSRWRKAMLKLFKGIALVYAEDEEFRSAMPGK